MTMHTSTLSINTETCSTAQIILWSRDPYVQCSEAILKNPPFIRTIMQTRYPTQTPTSPPPTPLTTQSLHPNPTLRISAPLRF